MAFLSVASSHCCVLGAHFLLSAGAAVVLVAGLQDLERSRKKTWQRVTAVRSCSICGSKEVVAVLVGSLLSPLGKPEKSCVGYEKEWVRLPVLCGVWFAGKSNSGDAGCCAAGQVEQYLGAAGPCHHLPASCFPLDAPGAGKSLTALPGWLQGLPCWCCSVGVVSALKVDYTHCVSSSFEIYLLKIAGEWLGKWPWFIEINAQIWILACGLDACCTYHCPVFVSGPKHNLT